MSITEARAQAALDSERLRQIAEWLRMDLGHEEVAKRVDQIADRHDVLAALPETPRPQEAIEDREQLLAVVGGNVPPSQRAPAPRWAGTGGGNQRRGFGKRHLRSSLHACSPGGC